MQELEPRPLKPTRILVVEDDPVVARDLQHQIQDLGCECVGHAVAGEPAICLAGELRPDLVLMDVQLVGAMDGITAAQAIREQFALPVVFLTAFTGDTTIARAKLTDPFGYLIKPFRERDLRVGIELALYKHQTERKLQASEEHHRTILQAAMDGFCVVDWQGQVLEVNATYCRMSGYSATELLALRLSDLEATETAAAIATHIQKIMAQGFDRFESRHRRKDGGVFVVEVSVQYWPNDGGRFVVFLQEIMERKLAEQKLLRLQQELHDLSKAAHAALEAERRRTARELHDELGQSLTALKMDLESMRAGLTSHPELERRAQAMHVMLDSTIAATRRIAADLRPLMLDDLGLAAALDWLTQNFSKLTGIATDLVIDETVAQVPEPIASALYRITQESLTNVTKYAQATRTEVRLERDGEWVQLVVRDNGRGISATDQDKRGAFGLLGMRERVLLLSGEIAIGSEPGRGSQVCARIPLDAAKAR